jgi:hypothetical protein
MTMTDRLQALTGSADDYDALLDRSSGKRFVLTGEASHGTHEFYRERAEITKRLIACLQRRTGPTRTASTCTDAARATTKARKKRSR